MGIKKGVVRKCLYGFLIVYLLVVSGCGPSEPNLEETLEQANQLLESNSTAQAISLLESYNAFDSGEPRVLESLAFAYSSIGNHRSAAESFQSLANLLPEQPEYYLYAAQALKESDQTEDALQAYLDYLEAIPEDAAIQLEVARLNEELQRWDEALNNYLSSYRLKPRSQVALRLGELFLAKRNYPQARTWYTQALNLGDSEAEAMLGLLETALQSRRYQEAIGWMRQLDEKYPGQLDVSPLASARKDLANWQASQAELAEATERIGDISVEAEDEVAESPQRTEVEETESEIVVELETTTPDVEQSDVSSSVENQASDATSGAIVEVVENPGPPEDTEPSENISKEDAVALSESESELRTTENEQFIDQSNNLSEKLLEAQTARNEGRDTDAIRLYKNILSRNDSRADVWYELSEVYLGQGDLQWADAAALEAIRREPGNVRYTLQHLKIVRQMGENQTLLQELLRARSRFPNYPDITLALARAYMNVARNRRNASILYREFLAQAPDHPQASIARAELEAL